MAPRETDVQQDESIILLERPDWKLERTKRAKYQLATKTKSYGLRETKALV